MWVLSTATTRLLGQPLADEGKGGSGGDKPVSLQTSFFPVFLVAYTTAHMFVLFADGSLRVGRVANKRSVCQQCDKLERVVSSRVGGARAEDE